MYWKVWINRNVSFTERSIGRLFMVIWRSVFLGLMINRFLKKKFNKDFIMLDLKFDKKMFVIILIFIVNVLVFNILLIVYFFEFVNCSGI